MILMTCDEVPGRRIIKTLGLARGNTIRSRHLGRDVMAWLREIVGGEIADYTKMLAEARDQALDRFSTSETMTSAVEILAYGTAVVIE